MQSVQNQTDTIFLIIIRAVLEFSCILLQRPLHQFQQLRWHGLQKCLEIDASGQKVFSGDEYSCPGFPIAPEPRYPIITQFGKEHGNAAKGYGIGN